MNSAPSHPVTPEESSPGASDNLDQLHSNMGHMAQMGIDSPSINGDMLDTVGPDDCASTTNPVPQGGSTKGQKHERDRYQINKLEKRLCRLVGKAIMDYAMIEAGDRVMVCLSGGKDSYSMLDILLKLRQRSPVPFELVAVNLDQRQPGFPAEVLPNYLQSLGIEYYIETKDTYSIVQGKIAPGKTTCSLCSRLRRGILYSMAEQLHCNKIALGHHRDDMLQTLLLNMFFGARIKGMPPKLVTDNGQFIVIRPLAYVVESDLSDWAQYRRFPIIACNLCGSQPNLQRKQIGDMLRDWEKRFPGRVENMFKSIGNITPSHMMDHNLYDFKSLKADGTPSPHEPLLWSEAQDIEPESNAKDSVARIPISIQS